MKKLLALVLCIALVMSLAVVASAEEVREKVVIALSSTPTSFDPEVGDLVANKMVNECTHESLLGIDPATNAIIPELAAKYTISEDALTYTFVLNQGIKFHNGEELKASDVKFTFERALTMPDVSARLGNLEAVNVIDDYTVETVLKTVNQDWTVICADQLFSILSEKACTEDPEYGAKVGTGPFVATELTQNEKVVVDRFADYWGEAVPTQTIEFRVLTEASARTVALENDEVQIVFAPDTIDLEFIEANPDCQLLSVTGAAVKYLHFNASNEASSNEKVRQAIACALDRDEVILAAVNGYADPAYTMWGPNVYGYNAEVKTFDKDLDKAKALLAEAGYPNGVTMHICIQDQWTIQAQMIQDQLKQIGVELIIDTFDSAGYKDARKTSDIVFASVSYANNADDMRWSFGTGSSGNFGGWAISEYDALFDECMSASDEQVRLDACTKIQEMNAEHCGWIPVYVDTVYVGANAGITGAVISNVSIHNFSRIACAK